MRTDGLNARRVQRRPRRARSPFEIRNSSLEIRLLLTFPPSPLDEELHVRSILMPAVVLAPGKFAVEQAGVDRRHFRCSIVRLLADVARAQQPKDRSGRNRRHITSLLIQPISISTFRNSIADKRQSRRTKG